MASATQYDVTITYGYDANGNRVSIDGAAVATYNDRDQLLTYGQNSYTWTADGGLATKTAPAGTTHYTWNALAELTGATLPDGTALHYVYDGMGRRVGKEVNGTLAAGYLYAGGQIVAETDAQGTVTERFVYATRANVPDYLIKYNGDGTSGTYQLVSDQVGSVRLVIDAATGAVVQQIDYDVWGKITNDTNPGFQPLAFAGGLYDVDTRLVHFGARDYDPETARWISRDPILFAGGDVNLYRYVVDDPANFADPGGLDSAVATLNQAQQAAAWIATYQQQFQNIMNTGMAQLQCIEKLFGSNFDQNQVSPWFQENFDPFRSVPEFVKDRLVDAGRNLAIGALASGASSAAARGQVMRAGFYELGRLGLKGLSGASGLTASAALGLDTGDAVLSAIQTVGSAQCQCQIQ